MSPTAVLWIRVSSEPQSSGYSPESQEDRLREAARGCDVVAVYNVTESAKVSENRRRFKEMVEFVKASRVGRVYAWSQDRLGRHYKDFATIQSLIDDDGVSVVLVEPGRTISRDSPIADRFLFQVLAAMAESDNRKRAADTKRGMQKAAEKGRVPHLVPLGYLNAPDPSDPAGERRTVVKDAERAPLVAWAFEAFAGGGHSLATMAAELNARGLTTKPSPKRPPGPVTVGNLHKVLTNRFYAGQFLSGGVAYAGAYEPLVSPEIWERVQARLDGNRTQSRPAARKFFAFRQFLRCGHCHCALTADDPPGRHGRGRYVYYFCTSGKARKDPAWYKRKFGSDRCPQPYWKEEELDKVIEAEIGKLYVDEAVAAKVKEQLREASGGEEARAERERRRLTAAKARRQRHLKICYQDRLDERITFGQYAEVSRQVQADVARIDGELARLDDRNVRYKEQGSQVLDLLKGIRETYRAADMAGKHRMLEVMLDRIVLRGGEAFFYWQPPFDALYALGELFAERRMWGE